MRFKFLTTTNLQKLIIINSTESINIQQPKTAKPPQSLPDLTHYNIRHILNNISLFSHYSSHQQKINYFMSKTAVNPSPVKPQPVPYSKDKQRVGNPANASQLMKILADVMRSIITQNASFVAQNQLDFQNESDFKDEREQLVSRNKNYQVVVITNKSSIEKSKFGQKYRQSLDPRDQTLAHPFHFILQISAPANGSNSFMDTVAYQTLCQNIEEFIVDVVENVVSVSFNFLIDGKLKQNQSKDFASKNILLNVYSIFKQSIKTLTAQGILTKKDNKKLRFALIELVENCLNQVLVNLSSYYPQAPPTGGTPRMREALLSIDRNYNEQLDFLYTQNLKITREDNGDYTEFIMKVINRAIQVTGQIDAKDPLQQTLYEKFVAFSQHLFWVTQEDSYSSILQRLGNTVTFDDNDNKSLRSESVDYNLPNTNRPAQYQQQSQNKQSAPESPGFFGMFTKNQQPKQEPNKTNNRNSKNVKLPDKRQTTGSRNQKQLISAFMRKPIFAEEANASLIMQQNKQAKVEEMIKRHDFAMGQKIPGSVKPFSKKDLMDKNFSAKHSAVLRMLTKWAENLQNIFDNPQAYTTNRIYPFKTLTHEIVYPKKELKDELFKQITQRKREKQKIKDYLIGRNKVFQSAFFAKDNSPDLLRFIKRYTETRVMASKMNALLIQFMKEYVSQLINLLVEAGRTSLASQQGQFTIQKQSEINLVVFKIGDLMRSKIHCSETTFIRLLKTLYILDQTKTIKNEKPVFELVRIKNKLDSRDNNILINYLFMGKIQCELQMSVQNISGKQLNYYSFAHFLYELTRGKFGVLAECATIISQHDPIVSSSSSDLYYEPKKIIKRIKHTKKIEKTEKEPRIINIEQPKDQKPPPKKPQKEKLIRDIATNNNKQTQKQQKNENKMFVCRKCDNLKFEQNMQLLKRGDKQVNICNRCMITELRDPNTSSLDRQEYPEQRLLRDTKMAQEIISYLKKKQIDKLTNYEQLATRTRCLIFSINQKKTELQFSLFNRQQSQNIFYISRITKDLWQKQDLKQKNVQYEDITSKVKKASNVPEFTYICELSETAECLNILKRIKFIKFKQILNKLYTVDQKCQEKILRDSIVNVLENKNQSLQFNSNKQKLNIMNRFVEQHKTSSKARQIAESLSHIQFVFAEEINIQVLPAWLQMCRKTQLLNLSDNKITDITGLEKMVEIKELILKGNRLRQPDLRKFINLERLNVSDNDMQNFELKLLPPCLLELDIGDNKIQKFNLEFVPPNLRKLDLFGNHLSTLNIKQLPKSLENLDLSYNKIEKIDEVANYPFKVLLLSNNNLASFRISNMPNLREFAISENALREFQMRNCPNLVQLHIGCTSLPKLQIVDFPALIELSIQQNQKLKTLCIKQLPQINIINMTGLVLVAIDNLQIENLNQDGVTIGGTKKIVEYLQQRFSSIQFDEEDKEDQKIYDYAESEDQDQNRT